MKIAGYAIIGTILLVGLLMGIRSKNPDARVLGWFLILATGGMLIMLLGNT